MAIKIRGGNTQTHGPCLWLAGGSFFWRQLIKIKPIFHWSAVWNIGNERTISFWFDNWSGQQLRNLRDGRPRPQFQASSLRETFPLIPDIAPHLSSANILFTNQEDSLQWRWTPSGIYSANSIYKVMVSGGLMKWRYMWVWECHVPTKVKIFGFLAICERILTHDMMARWGMSCDMKCVLYTTCLCEDAQRLLFHCSYATQVWRSVEALVGKRVLVLGDTMKDTWNISYQSARVMGTKDRRQWATWFLCTIWFIWRQRNEMVFRGKALNAAMLAARIKDEGGLWLRFCRRNGRSEGIDVSWGL